VIKMSKHILTIFTKNRLKTDKSLEVAQKIEAHLDHKYKVLVFDKMVEKVEFFETPQDEDIATIQYDLSSLEKEIESLKGESENGNDE